MTKEEVSKMTPVDAVRLLKEGNKRFVENLKLNRNLLQQVNETRDGQNPFAVILSCMDSRTSAELIFDQGLGDVFSIRIAGNIVNDDILGSAEFGCKVVGAKALLVLGHTGCGAIKGAIDNVQLGHLGSVLSKIQRAMPSKDASFHSLTSNEKVSVVTINNVKQSIEDLRKNSAILSDLEKQGKIAILGGCYDISTGRVEFFNAS